MGPLQVSLEEKKPLKIILYISYFGIGLLEIKTMARYTNINTNQINIDYVIIMIVCSKRYEYGYSKLTIGLKFMVNINHLRQ